MPYEPGEDPGIESPETIYQIYRDYIKHEDELINRRSMSNIIFQGFLFAAYGFSVEFLRRPPIDKNLLAGLKFLPLILPLVGCTVGVLTLKSDQQSTSADRVCIRAASGGRPDASLIAHERI
jgi:hypothetical protein